MCTQCSHKVGTMNKTAAMKFRVEPELQAHFLSICKKLDRPCAQVLRELMRTFIESQSIKNQTDLFIDTPKN